MTFFGRVACRGSQRTARAGQTRRLTKPQDGRTDSPVHPPQEQVCHFQKHCKERPDVGQTSRLSPTASSRRLADSCSAPPTWKPTERLGVAGGTIADKTQVSFSKDSDPHLTRRGRRHRLLRGGTLSPLSCWSRSRRERRRSLVTPSRPTVPHSPSVVPPLTPAQFHTHGGWHHQPPTTAPPETHAPRLHPDPAHGGTSIHGVRAQRASQETRPTAEGSRRPASPGPRGTCGGSFCGRGLEGSRRLGGEHPTGHPHTCASLTRQRSAGGGGTHAPGHAPYFSHLLA